MKKSVKLDTSRLLGLRLEHSAKSGAKLGVKAISAKLGVKTKPARKA